MVELQSQMDATNSRLEAKIEDSNKRLENKIYSSTSRMEAMLRELLAGKASQTDFTLTQSISLPDTVQPLALQATPEPTATLETARPPSPTHGASGVSHPGGQEQVEVVVAEDVGGGTSMEEAEGGGIVDVEAHMVATRPSELVEKVAEDVHAIVDTHAPGEPAEKVN